jgi:type VI secretion system secreted protein VgrG
LGGSQVSLASFEARETISGHFDATITIISDIDDFDLLAEIGKPACVDIALDGEHLRYFHGLVTEGEQVGEIEGLGQVYRIGLGPQALFHDLGRNFRIFQDKTINEIVTSVLDDCGIKYEYKASGGTLQKVFTVQYAESDFAFVSRLLEEYGLYYFYEHLEDQHTLVICDQIGQHTEGTIKKLDYNAVAVSIGNANINLDEGSAFCFDWQEVAQSAAIYKFTFRDYDFKRPTNKLESMDEDAAKHTGDEVEYYDWPGRFYEKSVGDNKAQYRLEASRAQRVTYKGLTSSPGFYSGHKISVDGCPTNRFNTDYLVISTTSRLTNDAYRSAMGGGQTSLEFTVIPQSVQFRPPQITPKPSIVGPQSAIVTGKANEEIEVDEYGRIKVYFLWDRRDTRKDTSSCWVRVAQTGGLGNYIAPRVGQEVLVDFINGDPDRPIVTGRVYTEDDFRLLGLTDNAFKTRAVWRSKSYKKSSPTSYSDAIEPEPPERATPNRPPGNEIRMEDETDNEELLIRAEKDLHTFVRHFEFHSIGGKSKTFVGKDREVEVKENEKITIGASQTVDVTDEIKIEAGSKLTLICGTSTVEMTPSKITISSTQIEIKADASLTATGTGTAKLESSGITEVKGSMVKIN